MTNSSLSFFSRNSKEKWGAVIGILASILAAWLMIVLIYFNPYVKEVPDYEQQRIFLTRLGLPALGILIASLTGSANLMLAVFIVSLPFYGYMAGTPGIFKLYGLVLLATICAAFLIRIGKKQRQSNG